MADWQTRMMHLAEHVAAWSKDPSTKVGAVVMEPGTHVVLGLGYNGFPRGVGDDERLHDRPSKYPRIVHAEVNAILNASRNVRGAILYATKFPCAECAKVIIQAGIAEVGAPAIDGWWSESQEVAAEMFQEAQVLVREYVIVPEGATS